MRVEVERTVWRYALVAAGGWLALSVASPAGGQPPALAYGGGTCGKLAGGEALLCRGPNFVAFARTACLLGRNYLHPLVVRTIVDAYAQLATGSPRTWQYGDMGWEEGGGFAPHKTHQNGLAADFFVPVNDAAGPASVPISIFNEFGYGVEFDPSGRFEELEIDWQALALHLEALENAGKTHGVQIERIILDRGFQKLLLARAPRVRVLAARFNRTKPWIRHDEHYHVDFRVAAEYRRPWRCE